MASISARQLRNRVEHVRFCFASGVEFYDDEDDVVGLLGIVEEFLGLHPLQDVAITWVRILGSQSSKLMQFLTGLYVIY